MSDIPMSVGHPGEGVPFHIYDPPVISHDASDSFFEKPRFERTVTRCFGFTQVSRISRRDSCFGHRALETTITRAPERARILRPFRAHQRAPENYVNSPLLSPLKWHTHPGVGDVISRQTPKFFLN